MFNLLVSCICSTLGVVKEKKKAVACGGYIKHCKIRRWEISKKLEFKKKEKCKNGSYIFGHAKETTKGKKLVVKKEKEKSVFSRHDRMVNLKVRVAVQFARLSYFPFFRNPFIALRVYGVYRISRWASRFTATVVRSRWIGSNKRSCEFRVDFPLPRFAKAKPSGANKSWCKPWGCGGRQLCEVPVVRLVRRWSGGGWPCARGWAGTRASSWKSMVGASQAAKQQCVATLAATRLFSNLFPLLGYPPRILLVTISDRP